MTLRSHLLILVAAAVFPVLAFAGYVVLTLWEEQRAAYAESYLGNVRALAIAVDSETEGYSRAMQGLVAESDPDIERRRHICWIDEGRRDVKVGDRNIGGLQRGDT